MSEIFNRLKQTRPQAKDSWTDASAATVDVRAVPEEEERVSQRGKTGSTIESITELAVRLGTEFDLTAADQRIQTVLDPFTLVGEQYRLLRAKLTMMQRERGIRTLLVTSSVAQEGKTFTACSLAGVFAQEPDKRVLLIDADLRKPQADHQLGMTAPLEIKGLAQVLRGEAAPQDTLIRSSNMNFFFMPAGPVPENPAELLSSPALEQTINSLVQHFDWIVFDSPPVLSLADASLIAPLCDATMLIVRADKTPVKMIKEAIDRIGKDRLCGMVLNRGKQERSSRHYYRYYRSKAKQ